MNPGIVGVLNPRDLASRGLTGYNLLPFDQKKPPYWARTTPWVAVNINGTGSLFVGPRNLATILARWGEIIPIRSGPRPGTKQHVIE